MPNALAYGAKVIDAEVAVSGGGGTGGGHVIEDGGTALTQRDTLNFIGFDAEDDSTNSKTQIAEHELTQDELAEIMSTPPGPSTPTDFDDLANRPTVDVTPMSEIITPVPSVDVRRFKYSTDEQIVGEWIDGKPVYQKTVVVNSNLAPQSYIQVATGITNADIVISMDALIQYQYGDDQYWRSLNHVQDNSATSKYIQQFSTVSGTYYIFSRDDSTVTARYYCHTVTLRYTKTTDTN